MYVSTHTQVESQVAVYIYRGNFPSQFEKKKRGGPLGKIVNLVFLLWFVVQFRKKPGYLLPTKTTNFILL